MNSGSNNQEDFFQKNRVRFTGRFPELSALLCLDSQEDALQLLQSIPTTYSLVKTGSGNPTLSVNNVFLHSRYDPLRDAKRTIMDDGLFTNDGCVFAGCGLAYLPELYAARFPDSFLIIVEPDIFIFMLCLAARDLERLLSHRKLLFIVGTQACEVTALLEKTKLDELPVYTNSAITAPNSAWFAEFEALKKRNKEKKEINFNTLKRFGNLWLRNMCKNLEKMRDLGGIKGFAERFSDIPVLILAAGPTLDRILPQLPVLRRHALIIAVDTAVRACIRAGIEPDFIILVDPQYWNWRHLDGISCPNSILITESAAWPAVFRFKCRRIYLCSSLFPLGKFLEARTETNGELGAGGSVSTTAWDFAKHMGAKRIFIAGLDLGYPERRTHFTGSIFEERMHTVSNRFVPAETAAYLALYSAGPYPVPDYQGTTVLTDKRLILYAWWFESRLATYPENKTFTLSPEGVCIPGMLPTDSDALLNTPDVRQEIDRRLTELTAISVSDKKTQKFNKALQELLITLSDIQALANRGIELCESALASPLTQSRARVFSELDTIDRQILHHPAKEIVAMVFNPIVEQSQRHPGTDQIFEDNSAGTDNESRDNAIIRKSLRVYREIHAATEKNRTTISESYFR